MAAERPRSGKTVDMIRSGDTFCVYAVGRLRRDALDVQTTERCLLQASVAVDIYSLGQIEWRVSRAVGAPGGP